MSSDPKPPGPRAPTAGGTEDWAAALDEWDAQIDDAIGGALGGAEPASAAPSPAGFGEDEATQVPSTPFDPPLASDDAPLALDEPAPLDEPPPVEEGFAFDATTTPYAQALPAEDGDATADPLRDLFDEETTGDLDEPGLVIEHGDEPAADAEHPFAEPSAGADVAAAPVSPRAAEAIAALAAPEPAATEVYPTLPPRGAPAADPDAAEIVADFDEGPGNATRVVEHGELAPLLRGEARRAPEYDEDEDLEISVELQGALDQAAEVAAEVAAAAPPPAEEDFYDAIAIVPGRDEPSAPKPPPAAPTPEPHDEDDILTLRIPRSEDDPDRTPLPVAAPEPGFTAALQVPAAEAPVAFDGPPPEQQDLLSARPLRPDDAPATLAADGAGAPVTLDDEARRQFLGLLDTERLLADGPRTAVLAFEAALLCDRLGDAAGIGERLDAALRADSDHPGALWLARRVALASNDVEQAAGLLQRERAIAAPRERVGLLEWAAVVADRRGRHDEARAFDGEARLDGEAAAGAGFAAVAFARDRAAALLAARATIAADPRLAAAVDVELARREPDAAAATARQRAALDAEGRSPHAALGLWRTALRTGDRAAERDALDRLVDALPPSPLRAAAARRVAACELAAGEPAGRERLAALADGGDDLAAVFAVADPSEPPVGDPEIARRERVVAIAVDPGQRAAHRFELGAAEEARGRVGAAIAAYTEAIRDQPADRRAARALERARSLGGDKQAELDRHLRTAGTDAARAPWALVRAASLLLDLGRAGEALERLGEALDARPDDGDALALFATAAAAVGQEQAAAERLIAGAAATEDAAFAAGLRRRAARVLVAAGQLDRAFDVARAVGDLDAVADLARRGALDQPARVRALFGELARDAEPADGARLHLERASLAEAPDEAVGDLRRALELAPGLRGPLAVASRRLRASAPAECAVLLKTRWASLAPSDAARPRAAIEAALALAEDAADAEGAAALLADAGADPAVAAERTRVALLRGRDPGLTEAFEHALAEGPAPERRAALHYAWSRALARGGQADRAVQQLRLAHEALPAAAVYRAALELAWERAGDAARLGDLALADLREAPDTRHKVLAYQRLAFIDECLRGDAGSARMSYESIAELDQNDHDAARRLERLLIGERRGADLVALYDRLGISAQEPALAVAISLERARLRRRIPGGALDDAEVTAAIDNDLRLVLYKDPRSRPALREAYARAGERGDAAARSELAVRLADQAAAAAPPDPRAAAVYLARAAQAAVRLGRTEEALARAREALARSDAHLPALVLVADATLRGSDPAAAADAAEQLQRVLRAPAARRDAGLTAAALYQRDVGDRERAIRALRAVIDADPRCELAFERLRALLTDEAAWPQLAELFTQRLGVETDGQRLVALHVELARLCRDHLADPARARAELASALAQDGSAGDALLLLADLEEADGNHAAAAELLMRRAKVERSRPALAELLFRLGALYARHLDDAKRAIACFTRVLQVDPGHKEAIELIAEAYAKEWDWKGALAALQRLVSIETDPHRRVVLFHRAARIQEEGVKEPRHALQLYRAALELDPLHIPAVEALGQFFDRQSDVQSLRVLCDTTARRLRTGLASGPLEPGPFHSLFRIFTLRRAGDRAAIAAGVLDWMGAADADEKRALDRLRTREQYPGGALTDPAVDELLFDARVPTSFRNLMRFIEEPLLKAFRVDLKQAGVGRADRLPRNGHAVRDVANRVAADLGVRDFDVYVSPALGKKAFLELADPLSICLGSELLEGMHEHALRFLFARFFKMAQSHLALALRLPPAGLAALIAGIVRQFVPDFEPATLDRAAVAAEAQRVQRVLPKKLHAELHPFALECAAPSADLLAISAGLAATADRAGLLAAGAPGPALAMLERMGLSDAARELALFCVGEELPELRRIVGTSLG